MRNALAALLWLVAVAAAVLAMAVLVGAGMIRQAPGGFVIIGSAALVGLPAAGFAALVAPRALTGPGGLAGWSLLLLVGFPLWFPGERGDALSAGIGLSGRSLGFDPDSLARFASEADARLPALAAARPAPPPAREAHPERPAVGTPAPEMADHVVLPYEGRGRTLSLPVTIEGADGASAEVWMLFDTGATLTTLDTATLRRLGVDVPPDAPEVTVRTAAGERKTQVVVVPHVWVGGLDVAGVTISVCDACAELGENEGADAVVGLLGLNVSGQFLVTLDTAKEELVLQPRDGEQAASRSLDVAPWLDVSATASRWDDGRIEVEVRGANRSNRLVEKAEVAIRCGDTWMADLLRVPPRGRAVTVVALPRGTECAGYTVALERAVW